MFEYHGWVSVQDSPSDVDEKELRAATELIRPRIEQLAETLGFAALNWVNGMPQVNVSGLLNRRSGGGDDVIDLFRFIGKVAPGSYGVLYMHDDEGAHANEFRVLVLRRGAVSEQADPFLSPVVPTIEDE
ncbi:Imm7 family immunity protein [Actinomadura welshii]